MKTLFKQREALLSILIVVMTLAVATITADFISLANLVIVYNDTAILIILALGQMLVIITRCIDLSVAANLAFTAMVVSMLNSQFPEIPVVFLLIIGALLGMCLGMINGLLVWKLGIPAIVVTLGTMSIYRGAVFLLSDGKWVNAHEMSESFIDIPRYVLLGLPLMAWLSILMIAVMYYFSRYQRTGREIFAAGNSPVAAFYCGMDVGKLQFKAFTISGLLAGLCGYLWASRYAVAYVDVAAGFELQVIAACVIGGISIMGGVGTVLGCVLGALFLGVINNALPVIGISPFWQMAISGAVIVIAVVVNTRAEQGHTRIILKKATLKAA